jgi:myosin-7
MTTPVQVAFIDNKPVVELLSLKPYGLLNLLDEEVRMPQGGGGSAYSNNLT